MKIVSAKFIKGIVGEDDVLKDGLPQIAFIGRSNVGKSSVINTLVGQKELARSSPKAGLTKVLNVFLVNKKFYLIDLPGYGFAQGSRQNKNALSRLIDWYFFESQIEQKTVVLIIDAKVGPTNLDLGMLRELTRAEKNIVVLANKVDKLKQGEYKKQLDAISKAMSPYSIIPYSTIDKTGVKELSDLITEDKIYA